MPPEVAQRHFLGPAGSRDGLLARPSCDVWMLGAVMFELLSGVQVIASLFARLLRLTTADQTAPLLPSADNAAQQ